MVSTDVFIHSFIFCYEYPGCWFALNFNALVHLRKRTDLQFFSDVSYCQYRSDDFQTLDSLEKSSVGIFFKF